MVAEAIHESVRAERDGGCLGVASRKFAICHETNLSPITATALTAELLRITGEWLRELGASLTSSMRVSARLQQLDGIMPQR